MKNKKGLTLIELLAVITIIAILFVLLIPQISNGIEKSKITGIKTDLRSYDIGIRSYLLTSNLDELNEEQLNNYLDSTLQFADGESKKKNPYDVPYMYFIGIDSFKIYTVENKNKPREYAIEYNISNGEILSEIIGFDSEVIGKNYCADTTIKKNNDYEYTICQGEVTIEKYIGTIKEVTIPSTIEGKPVTTIADSSPNSSDPNFNKSFFSKGITSIIFPEEINYIGNNSFRGNNLTSVSLPKELNYLGQGAFHFNSLTSIIIPKNLKTLESSTFSSNNITNLVIPDNIISIKRDAFYNNKISSLILSANLERIEWGAFNTNNISDLTLPDKLNYLEKGVFANNQIKNVKIPSNLTIIPDAAFLSNKIVTLELHSNVKSIGYEAFYNNSLTTISIPSNLEQLGGRTFFNNPNLKTVNNCTSLNINSHFNSTPTITNTNC